MRNRVTDYWDAKVDAVEGGAQQLRTLGDSEFENALAEMEAAISDHVRILPGTTCFSK